MPRPGRGLSFTYNSIKLEHQAIQTRRAVSRVRGNYHLFLRNQPTKPQFKQADLVPKRMWSVPKMTHME
ncbi:uncharacterized protein A1O9_05989 [Exophiala aquamarina CBS 119918]|uniref:Uncharacterized protein n=1 Tax=Exophiala aquamarina CBS 119918 TaxID=1182545 RepID=A0A072PDW8_9EURO|nr:uncharacterized protein A1O9_05989 [Exophiala aquamarina CBS 119918]KEF58066.1 hypothetical protein A1O9_05989 [Exophiala aquamarina CBS 119918]